MTKFKAWLSAARLRTLPLSLSGIFMGAALAALAGYKDYTVFILALLTTVGFQITSNFANDYGDGVKGTDNEDRIGPARALQSGSLSRQELKRGIVVSIAINCILILAVLYAAFGKSLFWYAVIFGFLGLASIWAAINYTIGKRAYGYRGLGDLFVFIFFGLLGVIGSMFLFTHQLMSVSVLPAVAIGFLSVGVLNLNNMRDLETDAKAGKKTFAVVLGPVKAKRYHYFLLLASFMSMVCFSLLYFPRWESLVYLLAYLPVLRHIAGVSRVVNPSKYDPELKKLALSTFLMAVLSFIVFNNFL